MGWVENMLEQMLIGGELIANLLITGTQYIIDFCQMWFGMGTYAEFAPPAWMVIILLIVLAAGYRAINDIDSWIDNGADLLREIARNTKDKKERK